MHPMVEEDRDILARYASGDVDALETLVSKYRRQLFGLILNMTEGRADADEVFQEVWFRAIRGLSGYRDRNFMGWLARIAHNIVVDHSRRRRPTISMDAVSDDGPTLDIPDSGQDPAGLAASRELGERIQLAVRELPPEQREVFLMRTQTGLSFKEIATAQADWPDLLRIYRGRAETEGDVSARVEQLFRIAQIEATQVGDTDGADRRAGIDTGLDTDNQFVGVVLDPTGLGIQLPVPNDVGDLRAAIVMHAQCTGAGSALVYGENAHRCSAWVGSNSRLKD